MKKTYNQRLFGSPLANFLHESRFIWVKKMLYKRNNNSKFRMIEIGCLDARILSYLPSESIDYYYGLDAGWDGYTSQAIEKYKNFDNINFKISTSIDDIPTGEQADVAIAMQVFEYISDAQYVPYFQKLAEIGCKDIYITTSNERGLFMLSKLLVKTLLKKNVASYSLREIWHLITGNMDRIERNKNSMKGFDYKFLITKISNSYTIKEIVGLPFPWLPLALNFTVAIHATHKEL